MNLREIARTFYILTVNLRFFCGFSVNLRAIDRFFTRFTVYSPENLLPGNAPWFEKNGAFPGSKFSGEYTVNLVKNGQLLVKLRKIRKRTVNWLLIYKMYGQFPVNSRFPVLYLSQLPITGSVKLRLFFTVHPVNYLAHRKMDNTIIK